MDLANANFDPATNSTTSMRSKDPRKTSNNLNNNNNNSGVLSSMCSHCGGSSNKEAANNLILVQDVISIKSYLQKLRRILHDSDESNVIIADESIRSPSAIFDKITRENGRNKSTEDEINDLKKQIAILTQQNHDKDHMIANLQSQLEFSKESTVVQSSPLLRSQENFELPIRNHPGRKNGATQTDRVKVLSVSSDSGSNRSHSSSPAGAHGEA